MQRVAGHVEPEHLPLEGEPVLGLPLPLRDADVEDAADVLDREVRQIADPVDANVRGAALLAALALPAGRALAAAAATLSPA